MRSQAEATANRLRLAGDRSERFDMITVDPFIRALRESDTSIAGILRSSPGASPPGGYVLQWMPMYAISRRSFDVAFRTFASVFPHASFWYVRSMVCSLPVSSALPLTSDRCRAVRIPFGAARFNPSEFDQQKSYLPISSWTMRTLLNTSAHLTPKQELIQMIILIWNMRRHLSFFTDQRDY